jgi:hypothetical protein
MGRDGHPPPQHRVHAKAAADVGPRPAQVLKRRGVVHAGLLHGVGQDRQSGGIQSAEGTAVRLLRQRWADVEALAGELCRRGRMSGAEVLEVLGEPGYRTGKNRGSA